MDVADGIKAYTAVEFSHDRRFNRLSTIGYITG